MNINKIFKGATSLAVVTLLASCSSDYLSLAPETSVGTDQIVATVDGAKLAVNGMCKAMNTQYSGTEANQLNGEAYINTVYNEVFGPDYISDLWMSSLGANQYKMMLMHEPRYLIPGLPWRYCYNLINLANGVINGIDEAEGDEDERNFVKAQALTFRAHGYLKAMQLYGPRFEDAKNGETYCLVLREEQGTGDAPIVTYKTIMDLIYSDLQTAIELYDASGVERENIWEPDGTVARGLLCRAAMWNHDYATAQKMANEARKSYPVMDMKTYMSGFCDLNDEIMWAQSAEDSDIYYWSWGSHYTVNGRYVDTWGVGGGAMNIDLYRQMDPNDQRKVMYFMPDKVKAVTSAQNPGKITEADFWNSDLVSSTNMDVAVGAFKRDRDKPNLKFGLYNLCVFYSKKYREEIFTGSLSNKTGTDGFQCYYSVGQKGDVLIAKGQYATLKTTQFGAHYKFWSIAPYGTSYYPFMRGAEMCLNEAESAYYNGDVSTAQKCLAEVKKQRITGYTTCTLTGDALLDAIKLERRVELWGEGYCFPDLKRWNQPLERRAWVVDDPTSGNCPAEYSATIAPDYMNGWRWIIPAIETDYNHAADIKLLEY